MKTKTILFVTAIGAVLYWRSKKARVTAGASLGSDRPISAAPQLPSPSALIALPSIAPSAQTTTIEPLEYF